MVANRAGLWGCLLLLVACAWTGAAQASPLKAKTGILDPAPAPREPAAAQACELGPAGNDPPGFYRNDAWPRGEVEYIRGQHETTRILIDLALVSDSEREFDALFTRVFDKRPPVYLPATALRRDWPAFLVRHRALLGERGYRGKRPYEVKFSRPPGGGPYLGASGSLKRPYTPSSRSSAR